MSVQGLFEDNLDILNFVPDTIDRPRLGHASSRVEAVSYTCRYSRGCLCKLAKFDQVGIDMRVLSLKVFEPRFNKVRALDTCDQRLNLRR